MMRTDTYDPELWQLMPKELTTPMLRASWGKTRIADAYEAMLAAAPAPPASAQSEAKPVYPVYQIHSVDDGWQDVDIAEYGEWVYKKRIVYLAPPSAAPAKPVTSRDDIERAIAFHHSEMLANGPVVAMRKTLSAFSAAPTIITDEMVYDAINAYYASNQIGGEENYPKRMRDALTAALAARHAPTGADALEGWQFKKGHGQYWMVLAPNSCFALARDADDERSSSRILAQLAAILSKRGGAS